MFTNSFVIMFFHNRLLERWLKLCSYEIVLRDIGFELSSSNAMHAEAVIKTLDHVFIIFDNEVMNGNKKHFNIKHCKSLKTCFKKKKLVLRKFFLSLLQAK